MRSLRCGHARPRAAGERAVKFESAQLDNGLQVVAECNPNAYSAAFGVFVNAGSRDESDEISGVSHFLEHMMFKGTPTRSADDVNRQLDEMGSHSNARTGEEQTIYHATVLPEFQKPTLELLCDIMRPSLRAEDFETEKKVIVEEILMYEDQPPFGGHERIMSQCFNGHALSRSILGTVDSVTALTPAAMRAYFESRYSPDNMVVSAAGNVDFPAMVATLNELTAHWQPSGAARQVVATQPKPGYERMLKTQAAQEYVLQICNGPSATDPDRYATRLLTTIVGDDSGSRLFWELVDPGWVEYAGAAPYEYQAAGLLFSVICCEPGTAEENLERLDKVQKLLAAEGVTEHELELAKRKTISNLVLQGERPESRMFSVGTHWQIHQAYRSIQETIQHYQSVSRDQIHQAIERYSFADHFTLVVSPQESPSASAVIQPAQEGSQT